MIPNTRQPGPNRWKGPVISATALGIAGNQVESELRTQYSRPLSKVWQVNHEDNQAHEPEESAANEEQLRQVDESRCVEYSPRLDRLDAESQDPKWNAQRCQCNKALHTHRPRKSDLVY